MTQPKLPKAPFEAWHFLNDDGTTGYGGLVVEPGKTLRVRGELELCEHGLHWSLDALDALQYAPGGMVERVKVHGRVIHGDDKGVSSMRTCLWTADATPVLHEFALWCADNALALDPNPDPRSLNALVVKRAWLKGEATDDELAAARDAAWDAARAAAWDAAWAAARAAARAAAWAAARAAAWAAARDAAWDAAWAAQKAKLEELLLELAPSRAIA